MRPLAPVDEAADEYWWIGELTFAFFISILLEKIVFLNFWDRSRLGGLCPTREPW